MNILIISCREFTQASPGEQLITNALKELGHQVAVKAWDDVKPTDPYDTFVIRTLWDYSVRFNEFELWFKSMEEAKVPCINSLEIIRWNLNKSYLLELEKAGVEIPKSFIWDGQYLPNWSVLEDALGPAPFVFKPLISSGGRNTFLVQGDVSYSAAIDRMNKQAFIAQSYLREVKQGEFSAIIFNGRFSHAAVKTPQGGDFRVQTAYGGSVGKADLSTQHIKWTEMVASKAPGKPIIARVDFVLVEGRPILMELELFEPDLFLQFKPEAAKNLAKLITN